MVTKQLRCSGVMEAVRVIAAGYPDRVPHFEILGRCATPAALARDGCPPSPLLSSSFSPAVYATFGPLVTTASTRWQVLDSRVTVNVTVNVTVDVTVM